MDDSRIVSIAQLDHFLKVSGVFSFAARSRKEKYEWIDHALNRFNYLRLKKKKDKATIKQYIRRLTGMSPAQLKRLIKKKRETGAVRLADGWGRRHNFPVIYQPSDIALLLRVDSAHRRLSGPATKQILLREYEVYRRKEFSNLKNISIPHIYNLRATRQYQSKQVSISSTQAVQRNIGERKKPRNGGKPGFLRVDTVHQGDAEDERGLYHINLTDEVTQWEVVGCLRTIAEKDLSPLLGQCLRDFPFAIINFHSDNGGEFINYKVAEILNRLLITQTKSRSRHSNDNGLAEGKNGAVIRKWMGHNYIPRSLAGEINGFYRKYFNVYLNFHRPCGFATTYTDLKGRERKKYNIYLTPYQKLQTLENWTRYLAPGQTKRQLDIIQAAYSDTEFAEIVNQQYLNIFKPKS